MAKKKIEGVQSPWPEELKQFNLRLFAVDVQEAKRRAIVKGVPWQTYIRQMVHEMLKQSGTVE
jgi:predicted DNA binding CopG/RHH family protein